MCQRKGIANNIMILLFSNKHNYPCYCRLTAPKIVQILHNCMEEDNCRRFDSFDLLMENKLLISSSCHLIGSYTDSLKCRIDDLKVNTLN